MSCKLSLCLLCGFVLCFSWFALAQNTIPQDAAWQQSSTPVQVVYVADSAKLLTYNVNPQTLYPAQVGAPLSFKGNMCSLRMAPNDHFLYVTTCDANFQNTGLFVYTTDASGVPQTPATQVINANALYDLQIGPQTHFAYVVYRYPSGVAYKMLYEIERFLVDPSTGRISQPQIEAQYTLPNFDAEVCDLTIFGFNAAGSTLYDRVFCSSHEGPSATYYERTLDPQTGALGPDRQIYSWSSTCCAEGVTFVGSLMFDDVTPNDYQQGVSSVNIYPLVPNTNKPRLQCTAQMLEACGYAGASIHPSGKYLFMNITQDSTQIDKVELRQKKIVDTGNYIPYQFGKFSPDGTLVYGIYNSGPGYFIEIYGFNVTTSAVAPGGSIDVPSTLDSYFVAQRY